MTKFHLGRFRAPELTGRGWLNTTGQSPTLASLRGQVVLLDFWTFCCVNCLHVLEELRELEQRFGERLQVIGVHSPKFSHEADPEALAAAIQRYNVPHPVLDDPELTTWQAYGARAWPTLALIDQEGRVVARLAGEGHGPALAALIQELLGDPPGQLPETQPATLVTADDPPSSTAPLRFPAKMIVEPDGNLLVADAGHHTITELAPDDQRVLRRIGTGSRGFRNSPRPQFAEPNGLCLLPLSIRSYVGYDLVVADTVNHALRSVRLSDGQVDTVAGTGEQFQVGGRHNVTDSGGGSREYRLAEAERVPARSVRLSSPWDVAWSPTLGAVVVAMAGSHSLWAFDPKRGSIWLLAGTMNEGLVDGPATQAWLAQPSGLAIQAITRDDTEPAFARLVERIWFADSETSALRSLDLVPGISARVRTWIGHGLFDFGHRDGPAKQALLQHPLGVCVAPSGAPASPNPLRPAESGAVLIADTYNGAIRRFEPASGRVTTVAQGLQEPSGLICEGDSILVAESAAHRLVRVPLRGDTEGVHTDLGAEQTRRPVQEISPGPLNIFVLFRPAPGQKIDERFGPATMVKISSTPENLLLEGTGEGPELTRNIMVNPAVTEGVLHISAKAATCDRQGDNPACHLVQQDWGIPVKVTVVGTSTLDILLSG